MSMLHGTQQAGIGLRILTSTAKYNQHFLQSLIILLAQKTFPSLLCL